MDSTRSVAISLFWVVLFTCIVAIVPARARSQPRAPQSTGEWICRGQVRECTAEGLTGKVECIDAEGRGESADKARDDGLHDCASKLHDLHQREVTCRDASQMKCGELR